MPSPQPIAPARPRHTASIRQRRRWAIVATAAFVVASSLVLVLADLLVPPAVSHRGVHATAADEAFSATLRQQLAHGGDRVELAELVPEPWDTVCEIQPFELSAATLDEALAHGGMAPRRVAVPAELARVSDTDWLLVFLDGTRLARIVRFNHRHIETRDRPTCRARADATLLAVAAAPGTALKVMLAR